MPSVIFVPLRLRDAGRVERDRLAVVGGRDGAPARDVETAPAPGKNKPPADAAPPATDHESGKPAPKPS